MTLDEASGALHGDGKIVEEQQGQDDPKVVCGSNHLDQTPPDSGGTRASWVALSRVPCFLTRPLSWSRMGFLLPDSPTSSGRICTCSSALQGLGLFDGWARSIHQQTRRAARQSGSYHISG